MATSDLLKPRSFAPASRPAFSRVLLLSLTLALLAACGARTSLQESSQLRTDIQNELRVDAKVDVNEFNGKQAVTITFQTRPSGDLDVARELAVAIARARLPRATRVEVFTRL